jgi:hypothetical protein
MHVPTISELAGAFGEVPESVAEVGVGRYLALDAWPAGEVLVGSSVAGRSLRVYINPAAERVRVQINSPDPVVDLELDHVRAVDVIADNAPYRGISIRIGETQTFELRTYPEIDLRSS